MERWEHAEASLGALRWSDCNFDSMSFSVQHSYYWRRGGHLKSMKTEGSVAVEVAERIQETWDFVFPLHRHKGKKPLDLESIGIRKPKPSWTKPQNSAAGGSDRYIIRPVKMNLLHWVRKMLYKNFERYALPLACVVAGLSLLTLPTFAENQPIRVIAFGAHPDDCDLGAGGLAAKYAARGDKVKFVSLTNGDAGHQSMRREELAKRRRAEAQEAGRRIGIEYEVLDNHDGKLLPTLDVREQVIREIRKWKADIVIAPRPNDYHPDHRYTGVLVQDASYMVIVPDLVTDTPPLKRNPVFLYYSDRFTRPQPFRADIVVSIDDVFEKKINMLDAHVSQFYEWLPWTEGQFEQVPKDPADRKKWLAASMRGARKLQPEWRDALERRYGSPAAGVQHAEAFEITEYGRQPSEEEIPKLFPFFPER